MPHAEPNGASAPLLVEQNDAIVAPLSRIGDRRGGELCASSVPGREAMRALKRYIARAIWRLWQDCYPIGLTRLEVLVA